MNMFVYYNPEKFYNVTNACIPRALSRVYGENNVTSDDNTKQYWRQKLLNDGFEYVNIPAKPFKKRMTVSELAESNSNSIIVCSTSNHVVFIDDNNYYDIADSGNMCVFYYFRKEKHNGN